MTREIFHIGDKEYAASKIPAFAANSIIMKLQKLILPVLGEMAGKGQSADVMDMDVKDAFKVISEKLDDSVMTEIILPMFKLSVTSSITDNCKIDSESAINKVFCDADGLADLYELIFEVLKYNFSGFFTNLAGRFGSKLGTPLVTV